MKCDQCGKSAGAKICERTNPKNYRVTRVVLCSSCRRRLGIAPAELSRGPYRSSYGPPMPGRRTE